MTYMSDSNNSNNIVHGDVGEFMLTTVDNPFDPFNQFPEWYAFDEAHGYHTCGLLDRIVSNSEDLSEADQGILIQSAIDEIVRENVLGLHKKVSQVSS